MRGDRRARRSTPARSGSRPRARQSHLGAYGKPVPSRAAALDGDPGARRRARRRGQGHDRGHVGPRPVRRGVRRAVAKDIGRPVIVGGDHDRRATSPATPTTSSARVDAAGGDVYPQVACRPIVVQITLNDPFPFANVPAFDEILALERADRGRAATPTRRGASGPTRRCGRRGATSSTAPRSPRATSTATCSTGRRWPSSPPARGAPSIDVMVELALAEDLETRFRVAMTNDDEDERRRAARQRPACCSACPTPAPTPASCATPTTPPTCSATGAREQGRAHAWRRRCGASPATRPTVYGLTDRGVSPRARSPTSSCSTPTTVGTDAAAARRTTSPAAPTGSSPTAPASSTCGSPGTPCACRGPRSSTAHRGACCAAALSRRDRYRRGHDDDDRRGERDRTPDEAGTPGRRWMERRRFGRALRAPRPGDRRAAGRGGAGGRCRDGRGDHRCRCCRAGWRAMPLEERAAILHRLADLLVANDDGSAALNARDNGTPISTMRPGVYAPAWVRYYAGWIDKLDRQVVPVSGRRSRLRAARAVRRDRGDRAVERPDDGHGPEGRAGARRRQRGRRQAAGDRPVRCAALRRARARGGPAARRAQRRHRRGRSRPGARARPSGRQGLLHRRQGDRPAGDGRPPPRRSSRWRSSSAASRRTSCSPTPTSMSPPASPCCSASVCSPARAARCRPGCTCTTTSTTT